MSDYDDEQFGPHTADDLESEPLDADNGNDEDVDDEDDEEGEGGPIACPRCGNTREFAETNTILAYISGYDGGLHYTGDTDLDTQEVMLNDQGERQFRCEKCWEYFFVKVEVGS